MAAAAPPLIEAAALRVLAALGVGVAAGEAAKEQARKRQEQADKARDSTIARVEAPIRAKEKCKECPPDRGEAALQSTAGWSQDSIDYQRRIAQMPPAPQGYLVEWQFNGVRFDGFDSGLCLLREAKARYDQFFDEFGYRRDFWKGDEALLDQAVAQSKAASPQPPVQLRWHFMEPKSFRYFSKLFSAAKLQIETVHRP